MARSMLIQPDGKIIVGGSSFNSNDWDFSLIRFNTNGSIDNNFGKSGKVMSDFNQSGDEAESMAIQSDGKILLAGSSDSSDASGLIYRFALARYKSSGSLDSSFGNAGKVIVYGLNDAFASGIFIQANEKIVVAGYSNLNGIILMRFNADGGLDNSFGTKGVVATSIKGKNHGQAKSIVIQSDGKILVAGNSDTSLTNGYFNFALLRYKSNGKLDSTFGSGGIVTTTIGDGSEANALTIQKDGKILVTGSGIISAQTFFALARYDSTGVLDTTFGNGGIVAANSIYPYNEAYDLAVQTDGRILIAGISTYNAGSDFAILRFGTDGKIDSTFGASGIVLTTFSSPDNGAYAMKIQSDGKIVVTGYSAGIIGVARYINDQNLAVIDFPFLKNSVSVYPNPVNSVCTFEYELLKEETITLELYDITGQLIKTISEKQSKTKGKHIEQILLDENNSPGNYFLIITNGAQRQAVKLMQE